MQAMSAEEPLEFPQRRFRSGGEGVAVDPAGYAYKHQCVVYKETTIKSQRAAIKMLTCGATT